MLSKKEISELPENNIIFCRVRNECELKNGKPPSHCSQMNEPRKLDVVSTNKGLAERFSDLVDIALVQFRAHLTPNWNLFS